MMHLRPTMEELNEIENAFNKSDVRQLIRSLHIRTYP